MYSYSFLCISMVCLLHFYACLLYFYCISVVVLWYFHSISLVFLWYFYGVLCASLEFL